MGLSRTQSLEDELRHGNLEVSPPDFRALRSPRVWDAFASLLISGRILPNDQQLGKVTLEGPAGHASASGAAVWLFKPCTPRPPSPGLGCRPPCTAAVWLRLVTLSASCSALHPNQPGACLQELASLQPFRDPRDSEIEGSSRGCEVQSILIWRKGVEGGRRKQKSPPKHFFLSKEVSGDRVWGSLVHDVLITLDLGTRKSGFRLSQTPLKWGVSHCAVCLVPGSGEKALPLPAI